MKAKAEDIKVRREELARLMISQGALETAVKAGYELGLLQGHGHPVVCRMQEEEGHLAIVAWATHLGLKFEESHVETDWNEVDFILEFENYLEGKLKHKDVDMSDYLWHNPDWDRPHLSQYMKVCEPLRNNQLIDCKRSMSCE